MNRMAIRPAPFLLPLIIFVALVALLLFGLTQDPRKVPSPLIGQPMPSFRMPDLFNPERTISDAELRGQVTLLNVWASWCPSCRAEHEMLMSLAQRGDVRLVGLNWKDERHLALRVLRATGNPYALVGFDPENRVGIDWGVYGAPETFVIDRAGIIRHKHIGPIDRATWENTLAPLVARLGQEPSSRSPQ